MPARLGQAQTAPDPSSVVELFFAVLKLLLVAGLLICRGVIASSDRRA